MLNNRNMSRCPIIIDTAYQSAALLQSHVRERARPLLGGKTDGDNATAGKASSETAQRRTSMEG